jgi:FkbM family methyltransferase
MAKVGLRGLGINIGHSFDESGERWLCERACAQLDRPIVADVGANCGQFARMARALGASRVVSFEPVPASFARLEGAATEDQGIECHPYAVGETVGEIAFHVPDAASDAEIAARSDHTPDHNSKSVRVQMTTLDEFFRHRDDKPSFLKIDVEGFELEVLAGAKTLFKHLQVIQFEFSHYNLKRRQNLSDFEGALPHYRLYRLCPRSLMPLDTSHYLSNLFAFQNIVALQPRCERWFS